jgi:hypothetical protein
MAYEVGSYIDLRHLNKPRVEPLPATPKPRRSVRCSRQHVDDMVERFRYKLVGNKFIKVRQIPVAFA